MRLPYRFGRYTLISKIAEGGMAEIYRARYSGEGGFEKCVAIKRILPAWSERNDFVKMLCDEAKALVHLQHQNIVQVYELGKDAGSFYISMEYVEGADLRSLLKKVTSDIPIKYVCFIVSEILKGIDFAHNRRDENGRCLGIIHRDMSPQNILLSRNGEVKVADFGIAKGNHRSFETAAHQVKGKYAYMSPEQARGENVDARSDLYSIGVILFELLTRRKLYDAPNDLLTIEEVKRSELPYALEEMIPIGIRPIVRRALQRDAAGRYPSAKEFLCDINRFVAANKYLTHGIELSSYICEIFPDGGGAEILMPGIDKGTRALSKASFVSPGKCRRKWKGVGAWEAIALMTLLLGQVAHMDRGRNPITSSASINVPVPPPIPAPRDDPIVRPEMPEIPKATTVKKAERREGTLSVQARPWGYVYIPGVVQKKETPIRRMKIKAGDHLLKVFYEPENRWVQQRLTIADSSTTTCTVNFEKRSGLSCQNNR